MLRICLRVYGGRGGSNVIKHMYDKTLRTALWRSRGRVLATRGKMRSGASYSGFMIKRCARR
eukprot:7105984-Heterocapsa_arctica.AAC.1